MKISDYLKEMIGQKIVMKNRYGKPKNVTLMAVSKPMMINGTPVIKQRIFDQSIC